MMKRCCLLTLVVVLLFLKPIPHLALAQHVVDNSASQSIQQEYDVIVVGGEPEGVAAAVSAARNGAKTLLVEKRAELGGLFTYGMLNFLDIPQGETGESVSKGIFQEWHRLVGGGSAFGISEAKAAFKKLVVNEPNLTWLAETNVLGPVMEGKRVAGIKLQNHNGEYEIKARAFIDATQDADFAVMTGAPYFIGGDDIHSKNSKMAVTLMIHLKNIDWDKVKETASSKKFGEADVQDTVAWGFSKLHYDYIPKEKDTRLRGLNLVKINDEYFINALQIFGVDGLDEVAKKNAIEKGKRETNNILQFLKREFPGFEKAEIASYPTELYVRETRHILAEYQLPMSDVWTNKDHWDSIGFGAYPVDVQAQSSHDYGYVLSNPKQYAIPFRSLVPKEIDALLVVGRSAGFSSLAAGSARVVPTGMATGEAAGVAAALTVKKGVSFRELSKSRPLIETIRSTLEKQGAYVPHIEASYPYKGEWYDSSIQTLINYGIIIAGYDNNLKVDELATKHSFVNMLKGGIQRAKPAHIKIFEGRLDAIQARVTAAENGPLELEEAASILGELFHNETSTDWQKIIEKGLINQTTAQNISPKNHQLQRKELYGIVASILQN